ncbi:MAG: PrpF family protein [Candidatus Rokubacteria bacterium]|nr:PrpF family protein [Candidatus Rokubacteria bacterium]
MAQRKIRAVYMRGGTSRAVFFHERDLPAPGADRDRILSAALGSPDPYGRQLDGMGGGISSLSKACIIGPPTMAGADVDYTFAQVDVKTPVVDYKGNCGNCSSAVGPFAIDERLVRAVEPETTVRIHNTNTRKLIVAHVPVSDGEAAVTGDFELAGVPGKGARIALDFIDPGGAVSGTLLPTGAPRDVIDGIEASCVDATNPVVFVRARDLGLTGTETPTEIDDHRAVSERLEKIRVLAGERMGIPGSAAVPKVALVAPAAAFTALDGNRYEAEQVDLVARVISMRNCHRAFALTAAMCLGVAARLDGTLAHEAAAGAKGDVRLGHPSGVLPIDAAVTVREGAPSAGRVTVYRTARRLMEGFARIP